MSLRNLLYIEKRLGKNSILIKVPKINTMYIGAHKDFKKVLSLHGLNKQGSIKDDPRIIPKKRWLREYHLDELPQLFYNVIFKRNMKLIGIRARPKYVWNLFPVQHKERALKQKPALAGVSYAYSKLPTIKAERRYLAKQKIAKKKSIPLILIDLEHFLRIAYNKTILRQKSS